MVVSYSPYPPSAIPTNSGLGSRERERESSTGGRPPTKIGCLRNALHLWTLSLSLTKRLPLRYEFLLANLLSRKSRASMIPITEKTPPTMASRRVMRWDSGTCSSVTVMRKGDSSYTKKIPGMTPAWETEREERDERERRGKTWSMPPAAKSPITTGRNFSVTVYWLVVVAVESLRFEYCVGTTLRKYWNRPVPGLA
jgi:hypothetical protein